MKENLLDVELNELYVPLINLYSGKTFTQQDVVNIYKERAPTVLADIEKSLHGSFYLNDHAVLLDEGGYFLQQLKYDETYDKLIELTRTYERRPFYLKDIRSTYRGGTDSIVEMLKAIADWDEHVLDYRVKYISEIDVFQFYKR